MIKDPEQLLQSFEKYINILSKVVNEQSLSKLESELGERLVTAPRALKIKEGGYPGALIDFSLSVASNASLISKHLDNKKSLVKVSLIHELGRLGDFSSDLYIPQESEWHREKLGQHYKYNEECPKMSISHRTIWLCSSLGINLTQSEYIAVLTSQGLHLPENQFYGNINNPVVIGLQTSRGIVLSTHN